MKKIFNWTIGSFLRTISRIFAYLLVGFILAIVCSKFGINFGFIKVNAEMLPNFAEGLPVLNRTQMYECQTNNTCYNKPVEVQGLTTDTQIRNFSINTNSMILDIGGVAIQTNVNELKVGYLYLTNYYVCANKSLDNVNALIYNSNYGTPGQANTNYNSTSIASLSNIPGNGEQTFTSCKLYSGLYVPNVSNNWTTLRLKQSSSSSGWYFSLIAVENKELGIYSDTIKSIVENSNGNVVEAVDKVTEETKKTNDTINNSDTTGANSDANSFFNNFDSGDTGSLMNLVKLPLKFLNNLTKSCAPIELNTGYMGKITLPCLSSYLYNVSGFAPIFNIVSLVINGAIAYGCIKSIIECVHKLKNPDNDEIEVLDL